MAVEPTVKWTSFYAAGLIQANGLYVTGGLTSPFWELRTEPSMPSSFAMQTDWVAEIGASVVGAVSGDLAPAGHLVFTVAPTTAVQLLDYFPDGTATWEHLGNGQMVENVSDQAEGSVFLQFTGKGSYTLKLEYVSADSNYLSAKLATAVNVTVT
jgi:hypothetical protein